MVFGGGGLTSVTNASEVGCGSIPQCTSSGYGIAYTFGVGYWPLPFLGAEAAYLKPATDVVTGSSNLFRFDTEVDARVLTFVAKGGAPVGMARILRTVRHRLRRGDIAHEPGEPRGHRPDRRGRSGARGRHAKLGAQDRGVELADGGGAEIWFTRAVSAFGEFSRAILKGDPVDEVEGAIDYRLISFLFGVKVRLGG